MPVKWAKAPSGKWMILDAEPSERGNVVLEFNPHHGRQDALIFKDAEMAAAIVPGEPRYLDHHVTCPQAKEWRGRG